MDWRAYFEQCTAMVAASLPELTIPRYTEEFMTKFAKTSMKHWDDLENDAGFSLRSMSGLLNFGEKGNQFPPSSTCIMMQLNLTYLGAVMSPTENLDKLGMNYKKRRFIKLLVFHPLVLI